MDEYVSKEAFIKRFEGMNMSWVITMLDIFKEFPAADVVKVVRCKECQYFEEAKVNELGFLICPASGMEITENDFCSYGEERKND